MAPLLLLAGLALRLAADIVPAPLLLSIVASPIALVPVHELLHALAYGKGLRTPRLWSSIWMERGFWYVPYDGPLTRERVALMLTAPFLILSVLPLLALPTLPDGLRQGLAYLILVHASLCVGDLMTVGRLLRQTPRGALVHNQGWTTYWSAP